MTTTPTPQQPELILASSSAFRRELLQRLGLSFTCHSPDIDESPLNGETPTALAERLSIEKAQAVAKDFPNAAVIGSDQVPVRSSINGGSRNAEILNKPGNVENARLQLRASSGNEVVFITGLAVLAPNIEPQSCIVTTTVVFRQLSDSDIERYLAAEDATRCAGSFKSEALGVCLMESMNTSDPTALIGLPLIRLCGFLRTAGFALP